jgi:hypothetical protein
MLSRGGPITAGGEAGKFGRIGWLASADNSGSGR